MSEDRSLPPLRRPHERGPSFCCEEAKRFSEWIDKLMGGITQGGKKQPTREQLDTAKVLLVDEYRKERNGATKGHRDRLLDKDGDPCLYGVFIATLDRMAEITIDAPKIPRVQPTARPGGRKRQEQSQRFYGLPAFEIVPDEP